MQSAGILLIDDDRRLAEMVGRYLGCYFDECACGIPGTARRYLDYWFEQQYSDVPARCCRRYRRIRHHLCAAEVDWREVAADCDRDPSEDRRISVTL